MYDIYSLIYWTPHVFWCLSIVAREDKLPTTDWVKINIVLEGNFNLWFKQLQLW